MKIVAFTGLPFSGKTEAVSIASNRGYDVIRMGDMIWEETQRQGLDLTDQNVGRIATDLRKSGGNHVWAQYTLKKIRERSGINILIIDGIRNLEEVTFFKNNLSNEFILVAIHTNQSLRYKRGLVRGRIDDSLSLAMIKERDQREVGWGIHKVINAADEIIANNSGLIEFQDKINKLFDDLDKQ